MSTEKVINRWFAIVSAILIQLAPGAIYAKSAVAKVLSDPDGAYHFTAAQTARIISAALFFVSLMMIIFSLRW